MARRRKGLIEEGEGLTGGGGDVVAISHLENPPNLSIFSEKSSLETSRKVLLYATADYSGCLLSLSDPVFGSWSMFLLYPICIIRRDAFVLPVLLSWIVACIFASSLSGLTSLPPGVPCSM